MASPVSEIVPAQAMPTTQTLLYQSPASTTTRIDKLSCTNTGASTYNVTIYLVPNGNSYGAANATTNAQAITANATFNSPNEYGHYLNPGDAIWAIASNAAVNIAVGVTQVTG